MKLAEASAKGRELTIAHQGTYFTKRDVGRCLACEIGTLVVGALGVEQVESNYNDHTLPMFVQFEIAFPGLREKLVTYPIGEQTEVPLFWALEHLFEWDDWSREQIEAWLKELDL